MLNNKRFGVVCWLKILRSEIKSGVLIMIKILKVKFKENQ